MYTYNIPFFNIKIPTFLKFCLGHCFASFVRQDFYSPFDSLLLPWCMDQRALDHCFPIFSHSIPFDPSYCHGVWIEAPWIPFTPNSPLLHSSRSPMMRHVDWETAKIVPLVSYSNLFSFRLLLWRVDQNIMEPTHHFSFSLSCHFSRFPSNAMTHGSKDRGLPFLF